jgi:diguanylate cyclase (GGDEF)-like protein
VRSRAVTDFPLLAWLFLTLGAAHAGAAAADLLPGGPGGLASGVDAAVAIAVAAGLGWHRWGPVETVTRLAAPACVAAVGIAAVASGVRGAASGQPWFSADVVLAVAAAVAVPGVRAFALALVTAEIGWVAALVGGSGVRSGQGLSVAGWTLLGLLAAFTAATAGGVRWALEWLRDEIARADRSAGLHAVTDPLTGANNRRGLERLALPMIEHARRQGEAVHCLFLDVDEFRSVNDQVGRERGDEVLVGVHDALLASIRGTDVVARWAGDQFVVLGPGTGVSPLEMERRVRGHLAADRPLPAEAWPGNVSIGSATLVPWDEGNLDSLLGRAEEDMQLRRSLRRQGRTRPRPAPPRPAGTSSSGSNGSAGSPGSLGSSGSGGFGATGGAAEPGASGAPATERRGKPPATPPVPSD